MKVLFPVKQNTPNDIEFTFYCPGCEHHHGFKTTGKEPRWTFNGNMEKPTVQPSIRCRVPGDEEFPEEVCHFYITDGKIQYLTDCTHKLAGQTIDMVGDDG